MDRAARRLRPNESAALETLREEAEPIAIPPKNLHPVPAAAAKDKELTGKWSKPARRLHLRSHGATSRVNQTLILTALHIVKLHCASLETLFRLNAKVSSSARVRLY